MDKTYGTTLKQVSVIFLASIFLSVVHFHNGFPLLLNDSLGYLRRAYSLSESSHWSNTYVAYIGFFVHNFKSIHLPIIVQNVATASVIYLFCKKFLKNVTKLHFLIIIMALCCTSLVWISNMLMSDIFTPISLLIISITLFSTLTKFEIVYLSAISFISFSAHQSHILILPAFTIVIISIYALIRKRTAISLSKRNLLLLLIIFIASYIFEKNILNLFNEKSDVASEEIVDIKDPNTPEEADIYSGYYFVAVRISQSGMLGKILEDFCENDRVNYLCEKDTIYSPIMIKSTSIISRNSDNKEYIRFANDNKDLVLYSIKKPIFYYGMIRILMYKGFDLVGNANIRNFKPLMTHKSKFNNFKKLLTKINPKTPSEFKNSQQSKYNYRGINSTIMGKCNFVWWKILTPLLFLLLVFKKIKEKKISIPKEVYIMVLFLLLAHIINSLICSTFSNNGNVRYSARTMWLVNFGICILFHQLFCTSKKHIQSQENETNSAGALL